MLESLPAPARTIGLLAASNVFMTFAWYGHLKYLEQRPWVIAALDQLGHRPVRVPAAGPRPTGSAIRAASASAQLKIMQEVITLVVFVPFALFFMKQPLRLDFLWAGLCMLGAVYFVFRSA